MSGDYDSDNLPSLKPLPWFMKLAIFILNPLLVSRTNCEVLGLRRNHNSIKKNIPLSGKKVASFTEDLDLAEIKVFCKSKKCSINDYCGALLSNTFYEYFEKHQDEDGIKYKIPNEIDTLMPYSFRQPVKKLEEIRLKNDFAAAGIKLTIKKELEESLPITKKIYGSFKNSLKPFGTLGLVQISVNLPFTIPKVNLDWLTDKYSIIFSNLNASKKPY